MGPGHIIAFACTAVSLLAMPERTQLQRWHPAATLEQQLRPDAPGFTDPKTGKIWMPDNVGQDGGPLDPSDRALDAEGHAAFPQPPVEIEPYIEIIGKLPITAGPTVSLVTIDNLSIRTAPAGRWQVVFYVQNNSDSTLAAEVACTFRNGEKAVARAVIFVPPAAPGTRLAVFFTGPATTIFIDGMACQVISP